LTYNGYGDGNGYGNGDGDGDGYGYGYGDGYGNGDGNGNGYGNGDGDGYGNGDGDGNGIYRVKLWGEWFEVFGKIENSLCINLPPHLYSKIDREFLQQVDNLECLRLLREKIGLEKYLSLYDAKVINEEVDNQGNLMRLYEFVEQGERVIMYEGVCPSTGRLYHMFPPNQKAKTCFEAKASTFGKSADVFKMKFSES
jgi:hypothetical protein